MGPHQKDFVKHVAHIAWLPGHRPPNGGVDLSLTFHRVGQNLMGVMQYVKVARGAHPNNKMARGLVQEHGTCVRCLLCSSLHTAKCSDGCRLTFVKAGTRTLSARRGMEAKHSSERKLMAAT
eukprot:scaffold200269_cov32-Tisochrysis_lutea.AAC.2